MAKRTSKKAKDDLVMDELPEVETPSKKGKSMISKKNITIGLAVIILAALAFYFKSLVVAAMVNGQPISRLKIIDSLEKKSGKQALDSMITETLIMQEAKKKNVTVSQDEVNTELKNLEDNMKSQGQDLNQALSMQGMTKNELMTQIKLQKIIEKLIGSDIQISDKDVDDYLKTNKDMFPKDMKPEDLKTNAKKQLTQQKLGDKFQTWLADLKKNAKINYFVNY